MGAFAGKRPPRIVPPPIVIALSDGMISIDRPVGSFLQQAEGITGPWGGLSDASHPYKTKTIATNGTRFFRAVFSP